MYYYIQFILLRLNYLCSVVSNMTEVYSLVTIFSEELILFSDFSDSFIAAE